MAAPRTHVKNHWLTGRPRIQTQWVFGPREQRRWLIFGSKLAIFLSLTWLTFDGRPMLRIDFAEQRLYAFGQVFWPQDMYVVALAFAAAALLLFITASLVGRVFCGHACPHTLLQNLFFMIDEFVEGPRLKRLALDAGTAPTSAKLRRVAKHGIWLAVAGWLGFTFVSYFVGPWALAARLAAPSPTDPAVWVTLFFAGLTYLFAGHLRDWVCVQACPYGRFQGVMADRSTLCVTYDVERGEPRGKTPEVRAHAGCVDCGQCVTVCPMGIDIRNGLQYECIGCERCIDACDATMGKLGLPIGLVAYAALKPQQAAMPATATQAMGATAPSIAAQAMGATAPSTTAQAMGATASSIAAQAMGATAPSTAAPGGGTAERPSLGRMLWYAGVLSALVGAIAFSVTTRPLVALQANRDTTHALKLSDGRASNLYALSLLNKDTRSRRVSVTLEGVAGNLLIGENPLELAPGSDRRVSASVVLADAGAAPTPFHFVVRDAVTTEVVAKTAGTFVPPLGVPGGGR